MTKRSVKYMITVMMLLAVALYFIAGTYARYIDTYTGTGSIDIAKWAVKVNGKTAKDSETINVNFEFERNTNVVNGKIAPGVTAVGALNVDLTDTEVAVDLIVEKGDEFDSKLSELGFTNDQVKFTIEQSSENRSKIKNVTGLGTTEAPYVVPLQDGAAFTESNGLFGVELTVKWENNESNNENDTTVGSTHGGSKLELPVKITVKQHIEE